MKRLWVILLFVPFIAVLQSCADFGSEDKEGIKNFVERDSVSVSIGQIITVENNINQTIIITDSLAHIDYGLKYPVTYEFEIPQDSENLNVFRKYKDSQDWNLIEVVQPTLVENKAPLSQIKVLPFKEKSEWTLVAKYNIGKKPEDSKSASTTV